MHYFVLIWLALCKQISDGAWDGLVIEIDTFLSLSKIRYLMVVKKLGLYRTVFIFNHIPIGTLSVLKIYIITANITL